MQCNLNRSLDRELNGASDIVIIDKKTNDEADLMHFR